jgi:hypothetical protein
MLQPTEIVISDVFSSPAFLIIVGLLIAGFWLLWFLTLLGIRQEQNEFREEMKWRLDAIIQALKEK